MTEGSLSPQAAMAAFMLGRMDLNCEPAILARLVGVDEDAMDRALLELDEQGLLARDQVDRVRLTGPAPQLSADSLSLRPF